ncbi:MAG TPA: hypothetical protein VM537_24475 [Anaerolineae bacterium]|nr:hypothetical protein [Anaerolineae bacterium]
MKVVMVAVAVAVCCCCCCVDGVGASVTTKAVTDIGTFITDTFTNPIGIGTEFVMGDEANALALSFASGEFEIPLKLANIQSMYGDLSLGFTFAVDEVAGVDRARDFQPIGGATIRLTNIRGLELRAGARLVDSSISERKIQTRWFEIPYAWTVELRRPLS